MKKPYVTGIPWLQNANFNWDPSWRVPIHTAFAIPKGHVIAPERTAWPVPEWAFQSPSKCSPLQGWTGPEGPEGPKGPKGPEPAALDLTHHTAQILFGKLHGPFVLIGILPICDEDTA